MLLLLDGHPLHTLDVELSLSGNSDMNSWTTSGVHFTYYQDSAHNISRIHPYGGPVSGGTMLTVYPTDDLLLVDFGGEASGLQCRFQFWRGSISGSATERVDITVPASLSSCDGARTCGLGYGALACEAPPYAGPMVHGTADVVVEVSLNGQDFTNSAQTFSYYDPSVWRLRSLQPRGGPLGGNTSLLVETEQLQPLGDVRCRFGRWNLEMDATLEGPSRLRCLSPTHWRPRAGTQYEELQVTLNGQDYLDSPHAVIFTFYALDDTKGLAVTRISPLGGPAAGGTMLQLTGTGFWDFGGVHCHFARSDVLIPATRIGVSGLRCIAPVLEHSDVQLDVSVDVTINGHSHASTRSKLRFTYYGYVSISRVVPQGAPFGHSLPVTIWGFGFRDFDRGQGLLCQFGGMSVVAATRIPGSEGTSVICMSPSLDRDTPDALQCRTRTTVRVALNGAQMIYGAGDFTFL